MTERKSLLDLFLHVQRLRLARLLLRMARTTSRFEDAAQAYAQRVLSR
ncbi:hypothetical protein [Methylocystis echinoides]